MGVESKYDIKARYKRTEATEQIVADETFISEVHSGVIELIRTQYPKLKVFELKNRNDLIYEAAREVIKRLDPNMILDESKKIERHIANDILGVGVLSPLMATNNVENIKVFSWDNVCIEVGGKIKKTEVKFRSEENLRKTVERMAMLGGRRIDESFPNVSVTLPDGSRATITIPPISKRGTTLAIRRFLVSYSFDELVKHGVFTKESGDLIKKAVENGYSVLVIGEMGSGKTTVTNGLTGIIPATNSIAIVEDTKEIQCQHDNYFQYEARLPNVEGKGAITMGDLTSSVLLHIKPNSIVLGECKGPEAFYVMVSMNLGHMVITTFHANSPMEAIFIRMPNMIAGSEQGRFLGKDTILSNLALGADLLLQMKQLKDGSHKCIEIAEVIPEKNGLDILPNVRTIFKYSDGLLRKVDSPQLFQKEKGYVH